MWHLKLKLGPQKGALGEVWKLKPTCFPKSQKKKKKKIWMEESTKK